MVSCHNIEEVETRIRAGWYVEDVFGNDLDSFSGYGVEIAKIRADQIFAHLHLKKQPYP